MSARATRLNGTILLDGRLDEGAWQTAEPITSFSQSYPYPGRDPRQRTDVRILFDNRALYVGVRAFDTAPDSIAAQLARRDASGIYSDWIHVIVDSYHDRRTAFRFSVNPRGVQKDAFEFNDTGEDLNWDAVWQVATAIDSLGWTAEYRIPLSQLRFGASLAGGARIWGFQVQRDIARYSERDTWSPWTQQSPGYVSSFGDLVGLADVPMPRRLELLPYASTRLTRAPGTSANPFYRPTKVRPSAGGDLRYGLPIGLTLSATVNPDFGQVEVDPAVVNLSAFETFFPEKRPFFLESADVFQFGQVRTNNDYGSQYFYYSRRIGRQPQRGAAGPGVSYVDAPDQSTILGALKVAGKSRGWTIGFTDAVTNREVANVAPAAYGRGTTPVEPLTNYSAGRVRRDFNTGQTTIGAMITTTHRSMSDTVFRPLLRSRALFGGMDFEHAWAKRAWGVSGYVAGSRVDGSITAIAGTQQSSTHYFQRPDAKYLHFDPRLTSLDGHLAEVALQKRGEWFGSLALKESSPGFEINDLGFQNRTDYRAVSSLTGYQTSRAGARLRSYSAFVATTTAWNFGGTKFYQNYAGAVSAVANNFWSLNGQMSFSPEVSNDRLTRGGPLARLPRQVGGSASIATDSRRPIILAGSQSLFRDGAGGHTSSTGLSIDTRPTSFIHVVLGPTLASTASTNQYVRAVADTTAVLTFGRRYVFADLHQTTLSLDSRIEWTFSTTLSLQLYAQPFVSAGRFTGFKEIASAGTRHYGVYGTTVGTISQDSARVYTVDPDGPAGPVQPFRFGNPDFNTRSLRGDAVLRWEYRPGSAVFVVWQQQRSTVAPYGDFDLTRDAGAIFRASPTNVLLVKATYWIGL